jgi:pimeloyl-ACP methyl ester carboxylesterase
MFEQNGVQAGFADIRGGRLFYEVAGDGPALVLAHAGIADRRMWDDQFLVFAQHYRVIRFDFWGFGKSTIANNIFLLHQDLYELLRFLGIEQAHLMGCSLGGRVIIDLALEYPKMVNSLIVVGSGLSGYQFEGEVLMRFVEQVIAARERNDYDGEIELKLQLWVDGRSRTPGQVDPRVRERAHEMLLGRPGVQGEGQQLEPAAIGRLSEINVPTLIIVGDRDETNIATIANLIVANVRGARKIIIPDTAHLANMEKPEHFNRVVLDFLRSNLS